MMKSINGQVAPGLSTPKARSWSRLLATPASWESFIITPKNAFNEFMKQADVDELTLQVSSE